MARAFIFALVSIAVSLPTRAQAELLEEIEVNVEKGIGEIRIRLSEQIHLQRFFPEEQGDQVEIFFNILTQGRTTDRPVDEVRRVPGNQVVPAFTITVPNQGQQKCVLRFQRRVNFMVRIGDDNRSLLVYIVHS